MAHLSRALDYQGEERRGSLRIRTLLAAVAHDEGSTGAWNCVVRNVSVTGVRLELEKPLPLPAQFRLDVPSRNMGRFAVVVWRKAAVVGIRFRADPAKSSRTGVTPRAPHWPN